MVPRSFLVVLLIAALVVVGAPGVMALSSTSGDVGPNFNESPGCGADGANSPYVGDTGVLPFSTRIYGPKADFFGRDKSQLNNSMLNYYLWSPDWFLPPEDREPRLHERLLPALDQVRQNLIDAAVVEGGPYPIDDLSDFVFRTVGGREYLSNHAMGTAIDINPAQNPYRTDNTPITNMPEWFRDAWRDAGFCWGGDWVNVKDTMHYSWMGPLATPNYGPRLGPYPPLTAARNFVAPHVDVTTPFETGVMAMADRSGDGADDLYRVRPGPSGLTVEAAGARSDFSVVGYRVDTAVSADPDDVTFADLDGDAMPDLVVFDRGASTFSGYSDASSFTEVVATGPIPVGAAELAFGYNDSDWILDLFAVTPGVTTGIAVYNSSTGYTSGPSATLALDSTDSSLALGDFDVDGNDDLYAVDPAGVLTVAIADGATFVKIDPVSTSLDMGTGSQLLIGDYDGDGRDDLYVAGEGRLRVHLGGAPLDPITQWFLPDDPSPWDAGPICAGPFACDQVGFVDGAAEWSIKDAPASEADDVSFLFGNPNDVPFSGDWDGDGIETPGLYRQSDGYVYLRNSSDQGIADRSFYFGNPGDVPIIGDFDGDGDDSVSLYRPSEQRFFIINELGSADGGLGAADFDFVFGDAGDKPFAGDFDGNGATDVGLHRESTGLVYYRFSLATGVADQSFIFGDPGDVVLTGDWDGDGVDTLAAYRPSNGNWYLKLAMEQGVADHSVHYHAHGEGTRPVVGLFATESG